MAFTVDDFQDLVHLLEQRPEWRSALRRLMLSDELLGLPTAFERLEAAVAALVEAQRRSEERLAGVEERQDRLETAIAALIEGQQRLEERQQRLEEGQQRLEQGQQRLTDQVGFLRGRELERHYRERAGAYFGRLVRRPRLLDVDELETLIEEGVAGGKIEPASVDELRLADLIVRGRRPGEEAETYLVVEISVGVGVSDVERAGRRAALLGRLRPALPVVAGERLTPEASQLAETTGVWQVLDWQITGPGEG